MEGLKANINTCWMLVEPFYTGQNYLNHIGCLLFSLPLTLSIECLHISFKTSHLTRSCIMNCLTSTPLKFLVHYAMFPLFKLIEQRLIPKQENVSSWDTKLVWSGFLLLDFHTNEIFVSRNVTFHEHILPYEPSSQSSSTSWNYFPSEHDQNTTTQHETSTTYPTHVISPHSTSNLNNDQTTDSINIPSPHPTPTPNHDQHIQISYNSTQPQSTTYPEPPTKTSSRLRHHSSYLQDYKCNSTATSDKKFKDILYPLTQFISHQKLSPSHSHYSLSLMSQTEPKTYSEASKHEC